MIRMMRLGMLLFVLTVYGQMAAQDWKSVVSGVAGALTGNKAESAASLEGTWTYVAPDCKFTSESVLANAGGEVVAKKVEEKMADVLKMLGFTEGCTYVFNADSTYTSTVRGRTAKGTYSYDAQTKELRMKTRLGVKFNATVSRPVLTPDKMSLLFNADKLMSLIQAIGGFAGDKSSSSAIGAANALLKEYDGLMLGFELRKESKGQAE